MPARAPAAPRPRPPPQRRRPAPRGARVRSDRGGSAARPRGQVRSRRGRRGSGSERCPARPALRSSECPAGPGTRRPRPPRRAGTPSSGSLPRRAGGHRRPLLPGPDLGPRPGISPRRPRRLRLEPGPTSSACRSEWTLPSAGNGSDAQLPSRCWREAAPTTGERRCELSPVKDGRSGAGDHRRATSVLVCSSKMMLTLPSEESTSVYSARDGTSQPASCASSWVTGQALASRK
ncbi:translation initiation factor IF-2-like [Lemur catta]|uniref:translation initiation factor IF-2-like n=1 Tax=Lemur catta TaxID=9447 RepID=UPI001E26D2F4|nr:translation initiation factor IF-2-like [Lemur catta]